MCLAGVIGAIDNLLNASLACAVRAAEVLTARFHAVPDDRDLAVDAPWSESVNGAGKGIEDVGGSTDRDFERLVVRVAAGLAGLHGRGLVQG